MLCVQWNGLISLSPQWVEAQMSCDVRLTTFVTAASKLYLLICDKNYSFMIQQDGGRNSELSKITTYSSCSGNRHPTHG